MLIVESSPLCRLCLQTGTWNINIFDPDGTNGFIVWKVIKELLGIEISKTDGLPSNICDACMKKLMEFKYFKKMCINSKIEFLKLQLNQGLIIPVNIEDEGFSLQIERSLQSVGHQEVDEIHVKVEEGIDLDEPSDNETTSLAGNDSEDSEGNGQEADGSSQSETSVKIERSDPDEALDNEVASIADEDSEDSEQEMDGSNEEEESDASSVAIRRQHDPINQSSKTLEFEEEQLTEQATKSSLLLSTKGQQRSSRSREAKKSDLGQCRSKETSEEDDPVAPSSSKSSKQSLTNETMPGKVFRGRKRILEKRNDLKPMVVAKKSCQPSINVSNTTHGRINPKTVSSNECKTEDNMFKDQEKLLGRSEDSDLVLYGCDLCKEMFERKWSLHSHIVSHGNAVKTFDCKHCGKGFSSALSRNQHAKRSHSKRLIYNCTLCPSKFKSKCRLKAHAKTHGRNYFCNVCLETFTVEVEYRNHLKQHGQLYLCDVCPEAFKQKHALDNHMVKHRRVGSNSFSCEMCHKTFASGPKLKRHSLVHTGKKPFSCHICGKATNLKSNLKKHMVVHTKDKSHLCKICFKGFGDSGSVKLHMLTHTGEKNHVCQICSKAFSLKSNLKVHLTVHQDEKNYSCDICKRTYKTRNNLTNHMKIHTVGKRFQCKICQKSFEVKAALQKHTLVHTGTKDHKCNICSKSFGLRENMKRHIATVHHGNKIYPCEDCGEKFSKKKDLRIHMVVHNGFKRFRCDHCLYSNNYKAHLCKHIKKHHMDKK